MAVEKSRETHVDALIIGAGMSGLAAGIRLAHFGKKCCSSIGIIRSADSTVFTRLTDAATMSVCTR